MTTTPTTYLPPPLPTTSITSLILSLSLPAPTTISPLNVSAAFHTIYLIHFDASTAASATPSIPARNDPDGSITLVLRISGAQIPTIKTLNEVAVMTWVRRNTNIPVPAVIAYSASRDNPLGYEFTLLERVPGVSVAEVYDTLDEGRKMKLVEQLAGEGKKEVEEEIVRGPPIEETYWQVPDLETYWSGTDETLETLNPFQSDGIHPSLSAHRDLIPRLEQFISVLESDDNLNNVPYVLAHKDLHFANIMCDPSSPECPITAVLDWEFASVVPAPRWNPVRAFLWNYRYGAEDKAERDRLERVFEEGRKEKGK
ncbi:hypothetical protein CBS63078_11124 [Aspergillus niger]|nr:hypothetical protein CBS11852_10048 [Aspergillus niger]KAI2885694.1 hypothetical protein CBS63078_11124 [Aspergillus niger]KAI2971203.1 hypothetical protein CBS147323_2999 [Aspergillus niger]KAI3004336.1 hypothetical protein CBS147345_7773 [Aspergillus niger]KAI3027370.1 hypothetical protein CBS147347_4656 [Aspergillus niger]